MEKRTYFQSMSIPLAIIISFSYGTSTLRGKSYAAYPDFRDRLCAIISFYNLHSWTSGGEIFLFPAVRITISFRCVTHLYVLFMMQQYKSFYALCILGFGNINPRILLIEMVILQIPVNHQLQKRIYKNNFQIACINKKLFLFY